MDNNKYKLDVTCSNCNYEGEVEINTGTELEVAECPKCRCQKLEKKPEGVYISRRQKNYE